MGSHRVGHDRSDLAAIIFLRTKTSPRTLNFSLDQRNSKSTLHMRWPKYWSFSFSISPSKEIPGFSTQKDLGRCLLSELMMHFKDLIVFDCCCNRRGKGPNSHPGQVLPTKVNAFDLCHVDQKRKFWQHWSDKCERVLGMETSV